MSAKKSGLGKGLDILFEENSSDMNSVSMVNISDIEPNKDQPRHIFNDQPLEELAQSIKEHGVLQPLLVRPLHNGSYQIVAGERRWRASRIAGLTELPVIIKELTASAAMEIALIENLQRENLNVIEEALGYKSLADDHKMTQEQISKRVSKSRPAIANALRLLNLPNMVIEMIKNDDISAGHGKALLAFEDHELISSIANQIVIKDLTVRDVERLAQMKKADPKAEVKEKTSWGDSYIKEVQLALASELGTKVKITQKGSKGVLAIEFYSEEELKTLSKLLSK